MNTCKHTKTIIIKEQRIVKDHLISFIKPWSQESTKTINVEIIKCAHCNKILHIKTLN